MKLTGIPVSQGMVLDKSYILTAIPEFEMEEKSDTPAEVSIALIDRAVHQVLGELKTSKLRMAGNTDHIALIQVQEAMLDDACFREDIIRNVKLGYSPEAAVMRAAKAQEEMLASLGDPYMVARAEDMHDISCRLACCIADKNYPDICGMNDPAIVVAQDLLPSMLISVDDSKVKGIIIERGTKTSHVSILAASIGIPMIVSCAGAMNIKDGTMVFLDSDKGEVYSDLNDDEHKRFMEIAASFSEEKAKLKDLAACEALSADGERMIVSANIVEPMGLSKVIENGMDGVGLFRTEFMYMNRKKLPTEEEQYTVYRLAAEKLAGKPIIIRTMDIGGDKTVECLDLQHEDNPFMGYRAIRICLDHKHIMLTQLRAILRASAYGNVWVMFPMIATAKELKAVLDMLSEVKAELKEQCVPFDAHIKVGIMVEIPSAVVMLDVLIKHLDFVSIGSNDLIQYTFAADRLNKNVGYLYNYMDPAVLRLIKHTINIAYRAGVECSICGEMAGEALGMAALVALGLKKFSISPSLGLMAKKRMSLLNAGKLAEVGTMMLEVENADEATEVLKAALPPKYS